MSKDEHLLEKALKHSVTAEREHTSHLKDPRPGCTVLQPLPAGGVTGTERVRNQRVTGLQHRSEYPTLTLTCKFIHELGAEALD